MLCQIVWKTICLLRQLILVPGIRSRTKYFRHQSTQTGVLEYEYWWIGGLADWWIDGLVDWWIGGLVDWWIGG